MNDFSFIYLRNERFKAFIISGKHTFIRAKMLP